MTSLIPFTFNSNMIRVVTDDRGEPLFVGKDVCDALAYKDHNAAMRDHCKGVRKSHPLQTAGGIQELRVLTEPDVLRLVVNSTLPAAEAFERLVFEEILPTIRRTGTYSGGQERPAMADVMAATRIVADDLRLPESGRLTVYGKVYETYGIPAGNILPRYAVDAGTVTSGSSRVTKSLTDLLKEHSPSLSTVKANNALVALGYLEELERPSSNGGTKRFKSVTPAGMKWGKNITSDSNPRQTQPHWFVDSFRDLLAEITARRQ